MDLLIVLLLCLCGKSTIATDVDALHPQNANPFGFTFPSNMSWNRLIGYDKPLFQNGTGPGIGGMDFFTGLAKMQSTLKKLFSQPGFLEKLYAAFKQNFPNSSNSNSSSRLPIFGETLFNIASHNMKYESGDVSWQQGLNQFGDWTEEEKTAITPSPPPSNRSSDVFDSAFVLKQSSTAPASMDWRTKNVIGPAKNQGQCGSCGIFAGIGVVEAVLSIKNRKGVYDLSEQEILDCRYKDCGGQLIDETLGYVRDNGVTNEQEYPYNDPAKRNSQCSATGKSHAARISSFVRTYRMGEPQVRDYVGTTGPVVMQLMVNNEWYNYKKGVYTGGCGQNSGHHALGIVGYGNQDGRDYWILKNSWGTTWGDKGFMFLSRGENKCGVNDWTYTVKA